MADKSESILDEVFKNLKLDDAITQAILKTMGKETQDKMMDGVMNYLTSVEGNSYYDKKTVLQNLFQNSIREQVQKTMHEVVAADFHAQFAHVADELLEVFNLLIAADCAMYDAVVGDVAFDYGELKAERRDTIL